MQITVRIRLPDGGPLDLTVAAPSSSAPSFAVRNTALARPGGRAGRPRRSPARRSRRRSGRRRRRSRADGLWFLYFDLDQRRSVTSVTVTATTPDGATASDSERHACRAARRSWSRRSTFHEAGERRCPSISRQAYTSKKSAPARGRSRASARAPPGSSGETERGPTQADAGHELGRLPADVRRLHRPAAAERARNSLSAVRRPRLLRQRRPAAVRRARRRAERRRRPRPTWRRTGSDRRRGDRPRRLGQQHPHRGRPASAARSPARATGPAAQWFRIRVALLPRRRPERRFVDPTDPDAARQPESARADAFEDFDNLSPMPTDRNFAQSVVNGASQLIAGARRARAARTPVAFTPACRWHDRRTDAAATLAELPR